MVITRCQLVNPRVAALFVLVLVFVNACSKETERMNQAKLTEFATSYAAAWSSQDPEQLASHYADNGSLQVNDGETAVGRAAIATKARGFMSAFPDMVVRMDSVGLAEDGRAVFRWLWTGTNTGPGGTGNAVHLTGYEEWTLTDDGLILESKGHYDQAEYERQVNDDG
jgi:hypothetical protein